MHTGLVTAIDADENPVPYRFRQLNEELEAEALDRRGDEEICILVPKRNIETWIYALFGNEVNEIEAYAKLENEGDCQPAVETLVVYLQNTRPDDLIPSLERGCRELRSCLVDGYSAETQRATCTNGAQASPVAGAEPREVMPLVSYRASAEPVLRWKRSDRVVPGCTRSAKSQRWERSDRVLAGVAIDSPPNSFSYL